MSSTGWLEISVAPILGPSEFNDVIVPPVEVSREGLIHLPDRPGMGYRVDPEKVARYRIRAEEFRA